MKSFFSNLRLEKIKQSLSDVSRRFPMAVIIIILTAACFFSLLHVNLQWALENNIIIATLSLIMTFFLSLWFNLHSESKNFIGIKKYLYQVIPVIFGLFFFFTFNSDVENFENMVFFFLSVVWIIWFLFFAPYIKNIIDGDGKQNTYYAYFYKISTLFLVSFILWGALFAWWAIAIWTVETLFWLWIYNEIYGDWAIIALCVFTPVFALSEIPQKTEFNKSSLSQNSFFSFLTKYVAVPFVVIYFLILYAYSIKVLFTFGDWPKGEVSWMVIGFSILGYITYIFSYSLEVKNKFIANFRKLFPYAVIPQIFMLFYAIYLRIAQYDLTINRYFVVVFGLWLLIISLYFVLSKKKYLWNIAALLTLFTILISVWPWSVYSLPESRQLSRLKDNLVQANIISSDNTITPLNDYSNIEKNLSKEIYEGIDYLCDFSNCKSIKNLFSDQYETMVEKDKKLFAQQKQADLDAYKNDPDFENKTKSIAQREYRELTKWEIVRQITEIIKVQKYTSYNDEKQRVSKSFYTDYNNAHFPIDIQGFSRIIKIYSNSYDISGEYWIVNSKTKTITIKKDNEIQETIDITDIINTLWGKSISQGKLSDNEMQFSINDTYKILFNSIDVPNPEYDWDTKTFYENTTWFLLIK